MIPLPTKEVRDRLSLYWGTEVVLRCCRDWPSHSMFYQRGNGKCGICHTTPKIISSNWEEYNDSNDYKS